MKLKNPIPPSMCNPAHWTWHRRRLEDLRDQLMESRDHQTANLSRPLEPGMSLWEDVGDEIDRDTALSLLVHEEDAIREVTDALRRIREGRYGICEETGKPIPAARLRAIPWTRFTKEAKERHERELQLNEA